MQEFLISSFSSANVPLLALLKKGILHLTYVYNILWPAFYFGSLATVHWNSYSSYSIGVAGFCLVYPAHDPLIAVS